MKTLIERASLLLEKVDNSVTDLARIAGVKPPSVSDWLNGKTKRLKAEPAVRLARHFGLNMLWVTEGTGAMHASDKRQEVEPGDGRLPIRRALFRLSAGVSGYEIEYENGESRPIYMDKSWFEHKGYRPEKLISLKVTGRSMEPKHNDGDLVIVNTESSIPKDGVPFAVNYEGEMVIKRMRRDAGQWFISSDNLDKTRYADKVCAEGCFVLGEVIYLQTENAL